MACPFWIDGVLGAASFRHRHKSHKHRAKEGRAAHGITTCGKATGGSFGRIESRSLPLLNSAREPSHRPLACFILVLFGSRTMRHMRRALFASSVMMTLAGPAHQRGFRQHQSPTPPIASSKQEPVHGASNAQALPGVLIKFRWRPGLAAPLLRTRDSTEPLSLQARARCRPCNIGLSREFFYFHAHKADHGAFFGPIVNSARSRRWAIFG
jgi:hypothetical protein